MAAEMSTTIRRCARLRRRLRRGEDRARRATRRRRTSASRDDATPPPPEPKPNDLQSSYLYNKIAGGPYGEDRPGVSSAAMPLNATLPATDIAMVKKWIESGAPED